MPRFKQFPPDYDMTRALELGYGADSTGHFPSRDYLTGRILKTPFHPTFKQTIEQDRGQGYRPFLGKDGRVYTISPSDIPKQGPFAPKFRNGGVVPRNNAEQLRPNIEINQRGPIATNPNFRQRSDDRTFSLPRETRERIFRSVEPNNYPKRELKKAALRYFKNQSYDLERNEGTPVTVVDNDAWAFFMGLGQKNNSVSRSAYVPTNAKDKNAKYFTLRNAYPDFDKKVLIDADDVFSDPDKIRLSPRGDFDNKMKVSDDNNTITGVRSRFYPLERVTYSRGEDERGKYYSIYDIYDFKVPFQKKIGQPYEVYDRTYYRDYGDGRNRVMYYNDNELLNFDPNKKNYSVLNLQEELYNRGYPLNSSLKEDGTFDGVLGPEVINALLDWRKQQQTQ